MSSLTESRIQSICPTLLDLLTADGRSTRSQVLHMLLDESTKTTHDSKTDPSDTSIPLYWQQVHLLLTLHILVARTSSELADAMFGTTVTSSRPTLTNGATSEETAIQPSYNNDSSALAAATNTISERLLLFRDLHAQLESKIQVSEQQQQQQQQHDCHAQLFVQAVSAYQLRPVERRVLQFLITTKLQPATCAMFLLLPPTMDYYSSLPGSGHGGDQQMAFLSSTVAYMTKATALDWNALTQDDHALCRDRILIVEQEEYSDVKKLTISNEAFKAFLFLAMTSEDKLKLAGTKLLDLVPMQKNGKGNTATAASGDDDDGLHPIVLPKTSEQSTTNLDIVGAGDTVDDILSKLQDSSFRSVDDDDDDGEADANFIEDEQGDRADVVHDDDQDGDDLVVNVEDTTKPVAFENELDYLHQYFEIAMHKVALSRQRATQDLKNASLDDAKPSWGMGLTEKSVKRRSVGEISAKLKLASRKMELSLALTREARGGPSFYPRLELLAEQLELDDFQKFVLVYLTGSMISPVFKSCIRAGEKSYSSNDSNATVGDLLVAYFGTFSEQVAARTYFYKSSILLRKGIIKPVCGYVPPPDLTDQLLRLDRRVLETIVGLDKESSEIVQGSHLYEPKVSLDDVVLPDKLKETITDSVSHFETFRTYRKLHPDFDEAISYGVGLTLMFCGKSGTGKTMTANAIAARLGKKLLLVNFPLLSRQSAKDDNHETKFQSIFREAELSDAIIFFDECESLFARRYSGGSADTTELLTELERFEGIVFLATNRPFDLDEAMYRRISEVFEFKPPNYLERLEIWKLVTSHKSVPCDPSIDWESIALKYELTGGFIKNAVISALLDGVGRDPNTPTITEEDILNGCKKQVRGALQMLDFDERVVPTDGLNDLVVSKDVMEELTEIVSLEKARGILFGSWGFDSAMRVRQGTTALFWGPSGTGRSRAAEAIGFELGKPLKVVDLPRLLMSGRKGDDPSGGGGQAVTSVFQEARLQDAVMVLDGFSLETDASGVADGTTSGDARLLNVVIREMSRFPGVVIMMIDTPGSLDVFASRIDKRLMKTLKFVVEFKLPSSGNRKILWERLLPPALPTLPGIDFAKLAEASHDFSVSHIGNAIYRAAAAAALRTNAADRFVRMKDLYAAIEGERTRGESSVDRWVKAQYI